MTGFLDDYGLLLLFAIIGLQAAGVGGLPGKTPLVTAAILAARGSFSITEVIVVAAVAGAGAIELAERNGTYAIVPLTFLFMGAAAYVLVRRRGRVRRATA